MGFLKEFKEGIDILRDPKMRGVLVDGLMNPSEYKNVGSVGERHTYRVLDSIFLTKAILRNVYLRKENGMTTEIDLLIVSRKGLFVIESKNFSGTIYGDENKKQWTQYLNQQNKYQFSNPINQNYSHIKALQYTLNDFPSLPCYNVVVFSERCKLKIGKVTAPNTYVIQRQDLETTLRRITRTDNIISEQQRDDIIERLQGMSRPDKEVQEQHIEDLKTKCLLCGGALIERERKKDGNKFWGCSGFPKCKFTRTT